MEANISGSGPARVELSVGQVAERSGVSVSALHFYERQGLLSSRRTQGNQRRYDRSVLRRVAVIRAAQQAGIPLAVINKAFAELPPDGVPDQADWQRLSAAWQQELNTRIRHLQALRDRLGGCIGCGCLSLAQCRFVNPDDSGTGTGARAFDI
ncbi:MULTISPECIES: redox-sensitive transcriptional activator SoxR [unclassified Arthrobacter]|uniref:redox-sensitive transcriptional activator SoxR n=1 Tax=unclassified Arthrobacter TaxID=235627 RepID=UPI001D13816E|nr:redox-sensitive transcriptional activator SoxR [Arthrobacter sp. zg-Y1110]MCC3289517.1 redox-sensitive transcriptional activator SoxR [Arthrobacter sp. zg-Y1110]MCC3300965.1 redox-sensitive transcriptional activator SoxR [Arthrobacter sp. zg-Y895]UWX85048.1 redox-sensitive transcriptional activator SoxR [Arthrobacter sp. zg-Y1110]